MAIGPRLDLRQSQQLVMTPQLQQAIKLLTLTNLELESYILTEIEKNPLLEAAGDDAGEAAAADAGEAMEGAGDVDGDSSADGGDVPEPATADQLLVQGGADDAPLDVDYAAETFHHDSISDGAGGLDGSLGVRGEGLGGALPEDSDGVDALGVQALSLADVLEEQAAARFSGAELLIARHLIDLIDEAGYLTGSLAEIALRLGVTPARVEDVLRGIQQFEPTGVGARNLAECLRLQAAEADRLDPAMACLLDHLDLVARGDLAALRRVCGVDQDDLADMIRELRSYNPKPGLAYGGERAQVVVPDIFVARTASGWAIELNSATLPRLLVNRSYYVELCGKTPGKDTRAYLADCLASANWLVKALDQRARTIIKVATELVRVQEGFFLHGVAHLKPMTLRMIADAIGMHESTVSRVTSSKYLTCDRGLFELKYFFTSSIQSADGGDAVSAEAVKARIRDMILAETAANILSDDKLVDLLRAEGFDIARRTVAKYREALGLGSSVQRRRAALLNGAHAA